MKNLETIKNSTNSFDNLRHSDNNKKAIIELLLCFLLGFLGRVLPHVPNATPLTGLSLLLGIRFSRYVVYGIMLLILVSSDFLLSVIYGFPVFSFTSIFVYSGFLIIAYLSNNAMRKINLRYYPLAMIVATSFYWLWTNFGVWLFSGFYAKNIIGLLNCYTLALPFLRNALIGDFVWGVVIVGVLMFQHNKREWRNWQTRWI